MTTLSSADKAEPALPGLVASSARQCSAVCALAVASGKWAVAVGTGQREWAEG